MSDDELPNPLDPRFWVRPAEELDDDLARLRAAGPVFMEEPEPPIDSPLPAGPGAWIVTEHAPILEMSRTPETFSSTEGITVQDVPREFNEFFSSMIVMDDPQHARLRRIVSKGFTPRMLDRLQASVQERAAHIVDGLAERGECDFVVDVAAALPLEIVCDLMGVPSSQYEFVFERTNTILGAGDPEYTPEGEDGFGALLRAGTDLTELMRDVAASKRAGSKKAGSKQHDDGEDLTSVLVNAEIEGDRLGPDELSSFFILLVAAGNETTRNAISWGLKYLTDNPEQRAIWADDFEAHAHTAVEEIVRLASPVAYMRRTATRDTELAGRRIAAGDKLCMFYLAANRDEAVFEDPLRFDVRRSPNDHIGFGGPGPHFCLGAHLARREITTMYRELFRRLPDIEATGPPDLLLSSFIHGVKHLPASFTPAA